MSTSVSSSPAHCAVNATGVMCDGAVPRGPGGVYQVPMVKDTMTFDGRQASRLRDMERRAEVEMKRKKREWEREVEKMRDEFLRLYPNDRLWGSDEMLSDPLVARRCGSTDILDEKKMRTLFLEYPDTGRRYRLRFDVSGFDQKSIHVSTDGDRIVVRASKVDEDGTARQFSRKIQKPKEVDHTKFKSYLTADRVLIVEAPMPAPVTHSVRKQPVVSSPSHNSSRSISPSTSPAGGADTPSKEKIGVPIFRDENGQRRLHLIVDVGTTFQPQDITVQVIKDNKIQVRAKHEEKSAERLHKSKFSKEYELSEKIETYSLTGGLAGDGRLIVGAYVKGHGEGCFSKPNSSSSTTDTTAATRSSTTAAPVDDDNQSAGGATITAVEPCEVLADPSSTVAPSGGGH